MPEDASPPGQQPFERAARTPTASQLRCAVRDRLRAAGIETADVEAGLLVAEALGVTPAELALAPQPNDEQVARVAAWTHRRAEREPLQHLLGWAGFRRLTLAVGPGVFIPRPETEVLVEAALAALSERAQASSDPGQPVVVGGAEGQVRVAVDLCAGSGAVALALADECPGLTVYAVEREPAAFAWLRRNVEGHREQCDRRGSRVCASRQDVCDPGLLAELRGSVDVVVSNPPYIPDDCVPRNPEVADYDPPAALFGGSDGLDVVRCVVQRAAELLCSGGTVAIEHGELQGATAPADVHTVAVLLSEAGGFDAIRTLTDLTGRPRVTVATRA